MSTADANVNNKTEPDTDKCATQTTANNANKFPDWLKADLFVKLLEQNVPDFKQIKSFSIEPTQEAGDNYSTIMTSVRLVVELKTGNTQQVSYMLKLPIEWVQNLLKGTNVFDVETMMYHTVIPELEKLYSDAGVEVKFGANYYELETPSKYGVILMEDLRLLGCRNAKRLEGLDKEHTERALIKLAQWHAGTATRVALKGEYDKVVSTGIFTEEFIVMMKDLNEQSTKLFNECVSAFNGYEVYKDAMEQCQKRVAGDFGSMLQSDPNEFNVLNHGDFWVNNIMFQYDAAGKIKETYFVDFQCCRYGTPVHDLYNLLISSTSLEVKLKHFDYFVKYYHDNLVENLKLLKYPKKLPTLKDIHIALYKNGIFGLFAAHGHMAIVLLEPSPDATLENLMGTSPESVEFKKRMYLSKRYREHAEVVLPWLYYRGAFE
ncbi:uncharacterized protein LOC126755434 [Bactrocera neohumeralis]|uniref:uncharacterized protein LOC120772094 n=1 Tax=Bactrocera tryoni TaxID=59916 RepID=UPI001A95E649|nr:uncharacterized protein LOC120772094 [Bactrocera tryoni]XP_050323963.1 uncharacterized protein LOC126755434 [Bactrocera neohumeralis]